MRHLLLIFAFIFNAFIYGVPAYAGLTITDIDFASNVDEKDDGTISKIYGGIAGLLTNCDALLPNQFCNSCSVPEEACNRTRIHPSLELRIQFRVDVEFEGFLSVGTDTGTYVPMPTIGAPTGSLNKDDVGEFRIAWGNICDRATDGADPNCQLAGGSIALIVGLATSTAAKPDDANQITLPIDVTLPSAAAIGPPPTGSNNGFETLICDDPAPSVGICNFLAYPGDRKVYLKDLQRVGTWPLSNSIRLQYLRVYYSSVSFADANYTKTSEFKDFEIDSSTDGVPTSDAIEGLENDVQYYFRPAVVDQAFNVAFLVDETAEIDLVPACAANTDLGCDLIAQPAEVFGLLSEDVNCFISTAAYGSSMAKEVQTFRHFRNKFLLRSEKGRVLNGLYYKYGPMAARLIAKHDFLKPVVRAGLWPLAYLAKQSNRHGLFVFIIGLMGMGLLLIGFSMSFIFGGRQLWQRIR